MKNTDTNRQSWTIIALVLGLSLWAIQRSYAQDAGEHPVKDLSKASKLIHWPDGFNPKETDAFVHNEIWIKAPAKVIWENLVNATEWPGWYANSADVKFTDSGKGRLEAGTVFTWKTFGFPIDSKINEYVPESRLGWFGNGTGIHAYHTWLILKKGDGCQVVTEESQVGPSAIKFNMEQPTAMYDAHHWWLTALKARSERLASQ